MNKSKYDICLWVKWPIGGASLHKLITDLPNMPDYRDTTFRCNECGNQETLLSSSGWKQCPRRQFGNFSKTVHDYSPAQWCDKHEHSLSPQLLVESSVTKTTREDTEWKEDYRNCGIFKGWQWVKVQHTSLVATFTYEVVAVCACCEKRFRVPRSDYSQPDLPLIKRDQANALPSLTRFTWRG